MKRAVLVFAAVSCILSCGPQRKLAELRDSRAVAQLNLTSRDELPELSLKSAARDTLKVKDEQGREVLIMKAVKDENGEMVATDVIDAAVVTARFRNVAERGGKVDLSFDVIIPGRMQDAKWQLRFDPHMYIMKDTVNLDKIVITGDEYRKEQLRGYEHYQRFLASIVTDTTKFVNTGQLEVFLKRNLPGIYRFRNDSTYITEEEFFSEYGVTEQEAVDHYTWWYMVRRNRWKIDNKDKMFRRYVKVPIDREGLRLDTVIAGDGGDIVYRYVQSVRTRPGLKKVGISLSGDIFQQDRRIYAIPPSDPLTFYISSLCSLVDDREKYLKKVIQRRVEANTACYIDFRQGSDEVDMALGENKGEISRIKDNLASLMENRKFDLDSIVVTASCSPEGGFKYNDNLSSMRSRSVSEYFRKYMDGYRDSLERDRGVVYDLAGEASDGEPELRFISRNNPENWDMLNSLVEKDSTLTRAQKESYALVSMEKDPDRRERMLQEQGYYTYLREKLYPRLRTVRFNFHLHRKGMVKDTVHTTVPDSVYMEGVQAIKDRDYTRAVTLLRPYRDYNTAVAYCAMDYNASAMDILKDLEKDSKVNYMMAILYSREGDDNNAVQCYLDACAANRAMVNRGNLDPEISTLIARYGLNKDI